MTSANEQLMLAKSQLESEVQRLESEVQRLANANKRLESDKKELEEQLENAKEKTKETDKWMCATLLKRADCIASLEKKIEELELRGPKDEHIAALEKKIEELDHTYSLGWAETSHSNAELTKANAELTKANADLEKENEEFRHFLDQLSSDEMVERNIEAMEETIESMQAEIYELHYFLSSKGYKARMLHAEGIRIPDEGAHAWWGFSACTRRNEDGSYSFFAHPDEEKTRPANMVNPNYGKKIRHYVGVTKSVINYLREGKQE